MRIGIIGGGIIGLACAWRLARDDHQVLLCDANSQTREASWAAAGMLAPHNEADQADDLWSLCTASFESWPQFLTELDIEAQTVDFRCHGSLDPLLDESDGEKLELKYQSLTQAGVDLRWLAGEELRAAEPALNPQIERALWLPGGHIDPRRLAVVLRQRCQELGVMLRYGRAAEGLDGTCLRLADGELHLCDQIVVAAGAWTPSLAALTGLSLKGEPVKGQMLAFGVDAQLLRHFVHSHHAYLVGRSGTGIVVGSSMEYVGFDHSDNQRAIDGLLAGARRVIPALEEEEPTETWVGLRPRLHGGLPMFARLNERLCIATGHFRNGILLTPISAAIVHSLVCGEPPPHPLTAFDGAAALAAG